jgi:double-stranded RNA-binding protein Staufen
MNGEIVPMMAPMMVVQNQHIMQQNPTVHGAHYLPQMQSSPPVNSTLPNPTFQNSTNQINNGENNVQKKTPKEKTPMCQVNEIAKFNKLQPKYVLAGEEGPPHHKTFTVYLELGAEKYEGTGTSIKKAQHAAAKRVIDNCETLDRPKYKPKRPKTINMDALTPTVKLNGLAMKRGEMAIYKILDRKPMYNNYQNNSQFPDNMPQIYPNNNSQKRGNARLPKLFVVELQVGDKVYSAEGRTRQQAKHEAAVQALDFYEKHPAPEKLPRPAVQLPPSMLSGNPTTSETQPKKSEVSLVYELALKRNLQVHFEKIAEEGPPHLKHYSIKLIVGKQDGNDDEEESSLFFTAEGQAQSKKLARRKAAIIVLEEMKKVIEAEEKEKPQQGKGRNKKKTACVKEKEEAAFPDLSLHPVSRLAQIQQAAKEREPIYQVISERSVARKKEFVMQCTINDKIATGMGPNKKTAKKNAAENMLRTMGHAPSIEQPDDEDKPVDKKQESQLVPPVISSKSPPVITASAGGNVVSGSGVPAQPSLGQVAESQLQYLASLQGYKVTFSDFPKDGRFLSLISIDTKPPLVAHGDGLTIPQAHEEAATQALQLLMTRGLGN